MNAMHNDQKRLTMVTAMAMVMMLASLGHADTPSSVMSANDAAALAPEQAVVFDPDMMWRTSHWAGWILNTNMAWLDATSGTPVFRVGEAGHRHVWIRYPDVPFEFEDYPIAVMTYRATGTHETSNAYVIWLDDGTGPSRGGIRPFRNSDLVSDGQVHEARQDLRELDPQGPISGLSLGVHAGDDGHATFELIGLRFERDPDAAEPTARFEEGEPITFHVTDEQGDPVPDATVTLDAERLNFARAGQTDAEGVASVRPLDNGSGTHMARIDAPGKARLELPGIDADRDTPVDVRVFAAQQYAGEVVDENNEPIAGAVVALMPTLSNSHEPAGINRIRATQTVAMLSDEQGRWQSPPLAADRLSVRLTHPDYVSDDVWRAFQPHDADLDAEQVTRLTMTRGVDIVGRVVDQAGEPVPDASIRVGTSRFGQSNPQTRTDEDGRFTIAQVQPDSIAALTVQATGHAPELVELRPDALQDDVEITLGPSNTITGRVVDTDGEPIADVRVAVDTWRNHRMLSLSANTDADGRFRLTDAPDDAVLVDVLKQGWMSVRRYSLTPTEIEADEHIIEMQRPLRITGKVVDADTGEPIPQFTVIPGLVWQRQPEPPAYWERQRASEHHDGTFEQQFTRSDANHAIRIEAPGYRPSISPTWNPGDGDQSHTFELTEATPIVGRALTPDGEPANAADVHVVAEGQQLTIGLAAMRPQAMRGLTVSADDQGRFELAPEPGSFSVVVLHDDGYAQVDDLNADSAAEQLESVELTRWARVEGRVMRGDQPLPNERLFLHAYQQFDPNSGPRISWSGSANSDADGRFRFARVPEGDVSVGRMQDMGGGRSMTINPERLTVEAGQTHELQIGGTGQPVVGQLIIPDDIAQRMDRSFSQATIVTHFEPEAPPLPDDWQQLSPDEQREWYEAWQETDEGVAFMQRMRERAAERRHLRAIIEPDGRFRVDDVPPGEYQFSFRAASNQGEALGTVGRTFTVEPTDNGHTDEPLDLGELTVTELPTLSVGEEAPPFEIEDLDGNPVRLADYRGQYVLLDFWATWCGPCIGETPNLKRVYDAFGDDDRFELIALSLDRDREAPRRYADDNELEWVQGFLGEWSGTDLPEQYAVQGIPQIMLIGPDGKVIARNLRGDAIYQAVSQALGRR